MLSCVPLPCPAIIGTCPKPERVNEAQHHTNREYLNSHVLSIHNLYTVSNRWPCKQTVLQCPAWRKFSKLLKYLACHWYTWSQMTGCPSLQFKLAPHTFTKSDNQKAALATQQHWLSCFSLLKIYSLWNTVQLWCSCDRASQTLCKVKNELYPTIYGVYWLNMFQAPVCPSSVLIVTTAFGDQPWKATWVT
jgi:hypothetical protein